MFLTRRLPLRGGQCSLPGCMVSMSSLLRRRWVYFRLLALTTTVSSSVSRTLPHVSRIDVTTDPSDLFHQLVSLPRPRTWPFSCTGISIVTFREIMDRRRLHLLQIKGQSHSSLPPFRTLLLCAQTQSRLLPCKHHKLAVIQSK